MTVTFDPDNGIYEAAELEGFSKTQLRKLAWVYRIKVPRRNDDMDTIEVVREILKAQNDWCRENDQYDPNQYMFDNNIVIRIVKKATQVLQPVLPFLRNVLPFVLAFIGLVASANIDVTGNTPDGVDTVVWIFWIAGCTVAGFGLGWLLRNFIQDPPEEGE